MSCVGQNPAVLQGMRSMCTASVDDQQAALVGEVVTSGAGGRGWGTPGCWGRAGSAEHEPSAAAVSQLQVIREGGEAGRKDVLGCICNPAEAQLLFTLWVDMSQTTWVVTRLPGGATVTTPARRGQGMIHR